MKTNVKCCDRNKIDRQKIKKKMKKLKQRLHPQVEGEDSLEENIK